MRPKSVQTHLTFLTHIGSHAVGESCLLSGHSPYFPLTASGNFDIVVGRNAALIKLQNNSMTA